ncbi:hypothetical protein Sru01_55500 [Sphaerisporangium rufum]|uniref:Uncharacterized protein n=1 Tax=Sphaerisporangium rufum TaxID=1381558 RepID=A0A919R7A4_9ACTN|nr:hypothetical protein [Sphaerisporangium rufum]GII80568.1 hypothetical protein Sru01_55500 [Sphaerisporangium rufum]
MKSCTPCEPRHRSATDGYAPAPGRRPFSDPAHLAGDVTVGPPGERPLTIKRSAEFLALRAEVEDLVRAEHRAHRSRV